MKISLDLFVIQMFYRQQPSLMFGLATLRFPNVLSYKKNLNSEFVLQQRIYPFHN